MINRQEEIKAIKAKGFAMQVEKDTHTHIPTDFGKIKIGAKTLDDAVLTLGTIVRIDKRLASRENIMRAIRTGNFSEMREISNFYYRISGIYGRLCRYIAGLYRYDWMITPYVNGDIQDMKIQEATLKGFNNALLYLDNFGVKRFFGDVALKVVRNGCYYGYVIPQGDKKAVVQELPVEYCRSRFFVNNKPAIEFNMKYFDIAFADAGQRMKILNLFPAEFKKGYLLYKQGKLPPQFKGDTVGWYLLDATAAIKFNINGEDFPSFISVIPAILDLDEAKDLDKKRMAQKLLKIIIQKMPTDKNGDLVFDVDEAQQLHNNAVQMLQKAIGIDVLTTFADVDVADVGDNSNVAATDELEKVERAVYNEAGVSQMQFNTDGNIALEKSILNDEASMYNLLLQFESFLNDLIDRFNTKPKKFYFRVQLLTTTIYNYKEMAKLYKEQTQLGYSKMLPQIALGQSQSSILANAYFENEVLDLVHVFIPPLMSSTMNADVLNTTKKTSGNDSNTNDNSNPEGGRPEKADDEKSEKTIKNEESQS